MEITDTHTHFYLKDFDEDRDEVITRALNRGVTRLFIPAIDSSYTQAMIQLYKKYPKNIFLMIGLHPTSVNLDFEKELNHVSSQLKSNIAYYAIGEIGIDLYWSTRYKEQQIQAFENQIRLSKQYGLPIVIHCRNAFDEVFEVLEREKNDSLRGIFHCFTGNIEQANQAISYNMLLGIGGVSTYKNGKIDQFLNQVDLSHIVLETDAPYLSPSPYRGKRNESSYIVEILKKVATIYGKSEIEVAKITTVNAIKVFGC